MAFAQTSQSIDAPQLKSNDSLHENHSLEIGVKSDLFIYQNDKTNVNGIILNYYTKGGFYIPVSIAISPDVQQYYAGYGYSLEILKKRLSYKIDAALSYIEYSNGYFSHLEGSPNYRHDVTALLNHHLNYRLNSRLSLDLHYNTDLLAMATMEGESSYAQRKRNVEATTLGLGLKIKLGK